MSLVAFAIVVYSLMSLYLRGENRKRDRGERDNVMAGLTEDEIVALGDENPRYRFAT